VARAAVKAKQQAKAKAQPAKPTRVRGRRRHSSGGNPNQQLFFMRIRRRQKWVFVLLAVVFAATFVGVGVGSGSGAGLDQLYNGLFGGGGNAVAKAQGEIKKDPAKGYRDLATAYETSGDNAKAILAFQSYLKLKKKDAAAWMELAGLQTAQGQTFVTQYQQTQQAAQLADPSQPFQAGGPLGQAIGSNPVYSNSSQQLTSQMSQLYLQAIGSLKAAVTSYQAATKARPRNATAWQGLASAAENAGITKVAIAAWKRYIKLYPNSPQRQRIEQHIRALEKQLAPAPPPSGK
jgi:tetratricopeptide (TPR) repeat protein